MKVRLDRLGEEPYTWQETLVLSREHLGHPQVHDLSEIACRGRISPTTPGFLLQVAISYEQTLSCTRCLRRVTRPVTNELELLVRIRQGDPLPGEAAVGERELSEEDLGMLLLDRPVLDTRPLLIEQIELSVPMKFLCRDQCAGFCGSCGADLNDGPCDCQQAGDPRWAGLAKWKESSGR